MQHGFDTPRVLTENLVPRTSMEILNVTLLLIYEPKICVSLDSVTDVTRFSDKPFMI